VSEPGSKTWSSGPKLVIADDGSVTLDGMAETAVKFSYLNMTFSEANLLFYMATPGAHAGKSTASAPTQRVKAFFGTYGGQKIAGLIASSATSKKPSRKESSFMTTFQVIAKYMGQINQAFIISDLIKKATGAQEKGDLSELGEVEGDLSSQITDLSQSQGEVATTQQSAIETEMGENPTLTFDQAADALRSAQADDLGVDEVEDVAEAQLDAAGEPILEVPVSEGGLDIAAAAGEDAAGDLVVDALLDDALMLVLL
jgi:hypothetical protein